MSEPSASSDFPTLFRQELEDVRAPGAAGAAVEPSFAIDPGAGPRPPAPVPENWVTYCPEDLVGLALSGGGIRSATFNLGLLQGLYRAGALGLFHYLSTVSGGGYIGGWWSAWRARHPSAGADLHARLFGGDPNGTESPEVHHLREFSYFLSPRPGFFSIEFWWSVGAVLEAFLPSILVGTSVLVTVLLLDFLLLLSSPFVVTLVLLLLLTLFELWYGRRTGPLRGRAAVGSWASHLFAAGLLFALLSWVEARLPVSRQLFFPGVPRFSRELYVTALVLLVVAAALVLLRLTGTLLRPLARRIVSFVARRGRVPQPDDEAARSSSLQRVFVRLVALAVLWALGVGVWDLAQFLAGPRWSMSSLVLSFGSSSLFAWLTRLLTRQPSRARRPGLRDTLRTLLPQAISYAAVALAAAGLAVGLLWLALPRAPFAILGVTSGILLLTLFFFDPNEIGLHAFYKSRIARAYLGASNRSSAGSVPPDDNRQTDVKSGDDVAFTALSGDLPVHLVCCTANDLAGDNLVNLGRDARSAVFSRHGFSMGNFFLPWNGTAPKTTLASALTASAASFNSNMGSKARNFGRAAPFLMSSFGLRLGLWLRTTPAKAAARGLLYFREMFGLTQADRADRPLHLSDGGHFENMGLYELLRRRCRYILVSDCGADPDVAFDDVGNALRRAREDFGAEIDLDLTPLKPGPNGFSAQHLAVGDIQYPNGYRGVLILIKPSLLGDEPDDILQYATRNRAFPHESTGDQFYDEAQWESYRRLGEHEAWSVFRFVKENERRGQIERASDVFGRVRFDYYPGPSDIQARALEGTAALGRIDERLASPGCEALLRQIYPELLAPQEEASSAATPAEITLITQMIQLMEDVFWRCRLETLWNHPVNMGWINCFGRWASAPMLRDLWPIVKPMYSPPFTRFAEKALSLPWVGDGRVAGDVKARKGLEESALARRLAALRSNFPPPGKAIYVFELRLEGGRSIEVALALLDVAPDRSVASWTAKDFIVPISLWSAGIGKAFLARLADRLLREEGCARLEVAVESRTTAEGDSKASADLVQMYLEEGFHYAATPSPRMEKTLLVLTAADLSRPARR